MIANVDREKMIDVYNDAITESVWLVLVQHAAEGAGMTVEEVLANIEAGRGYIEVMYVADKNHVAEPQAEPTGN